MHILKKNEKKKFSQFFAKRSEQQIECANFRSNIFALFFVRNERISSSKSKNLRI